MSRSTGEVFDTSWILDSRGSKNAVDRDRPYYFLAENELSAEGKIDDVATLFLTNRECPFRCLMCDLWKNTLDETISAEDLLKQIRFGLDNLKSDQTGELRFHQWKLYNSGNFFDRKAIPADTLPRIAELANRNSKNGVLSRIVVESHPRLIDDSCLTFAKSLDCRLEVAMGLETVHPEVLPRLNKNMALDDFQRATEFMRSNDIDVRAFILLRPPFLDEEEGVEWAIRSCEWAFDQGVQCCVVIPVRAGNGAIERLQQKGLFSPPKLESLELTQKTALKLAQNNNRLFVDLWDIEKLASCKDCLQLRKDRLHEINLTQVDQAEIICRHCSH